MKVQALIFLNDRKWHIYSADFNNNSSHNTNYYNQGSGSFGPFDASEYKYMLLFCAIDRQGPLRFWYLRYQELRGSSYYWQLDWRHNCCTIDGIIVIFCPNRKNMQEFDQELKKMAISMDLPILQEGIGSRNICEIPWKSVVLKSAGFGVFGWIQRKNPAAEQLAVPADPARRTPEQLLFFRNPLDQSNPLDRPKSSASRTSPQFQISPWYLTSFSVAWIFFCPRVFRLRFLKHSTHLSACWLLYLVVSSPP